MFGDQSLPIMQSCIYALLWAVIYCPVFPHLGDIFNQDVLIIHVIQTLITSLKTIG